MKFFRPLLTLALLFLHVFGFAQITFKGDLRLGDTSQVHILNTKDGSRLTGRVVGFDQEKLTFLFQNQNLLTFKIEEVESVEVQGGVPTPIAENLPEAPATESIGPAPFQYTVTTSNGKTYSGKLIKGNNQSIRLLNDDGSTRNLNWLEIDSLRHIGPAFDGQGDELHILHTLRGDRFTGQVQGYNNKTLYFLLANKDVLQFSTRDLRRIELAGGIVTTKPLDGQAGIPMQGHEKLYLSPSAFMLEKGTAEFRTFILYNSIEYGVSDNFTIGGDIATVIAASLLSAKAKFGGSLSDRLHVAGGLQLYGAFAIESEALSAAIAYGALTVGTPEKFLSVSIGRGTSSESSVGTTGLSLSGALRVGEQFRIFGEYLNFASIGDPARFAIAGGSWFNRNNRLDFGIVLIPLNFGGDTQSFLPLPVLSYAYRF